MRNRAIPPASVKDFFRGLFGQEQKPRLGAKPAAPVRREAPRQEIVELYKKSDVIGGKYEVYGTLGKGGFGVVYLAYDRESKVVCALKTFRDELLADPAARNAFKKEVLLWVNLERHPFILAARWVEEFSGRLFVRMDYVAPDDKGRVSLAQHIACANGPMDTDRVLEWAIQFCIGMEHASAHGITCHRDIKPANILVTQDGTLKISDFGLATAAEVAWVAVGAKGGSPIWRRDAEDIGFSLLENDGKVRCGTPGYMPPEVYRGETADIRSDIFSFGVVLWQMAAGSPMPPFVARYDGDIEKFLLETYAEQMKGRIPSVDGPLSRVVERCLRPQAAHRYRHFGELREVLAPMLRARTGRVVAVPQVEDQSAVFWNTKGAALDTLGKHEEAILCFDKVLAIDPMAAPAWNNKGRALVNLGRLQESLECYDKALAIYPLDVPAWNNKGSVLADLGRHQDALRCYDKALAIDPRAVQAWINRGNVLSDLGAQDQAVDCHNRALAVDPQNASAWMNKGNVLRRFGRHEEALKCFDKALAIDPLDVLAWNNKAGALHQLGRHDEAITCNDRALAIDPRNAAAWNFKGVALRALGRHEEARACYDRALAIDPLYSSAWYNRGIVYEALRQHREAIACYDKALAIDPRDVAVWGNKGGALYALGRHEEAIRCLDQALAIDRRNGAAWTNKGTALLEFGQYAEAIQCYEEALAIDPQSDAAAKGKRYALQMLGRRQ